MIAPVSFTFIALCMITVFGLVSWIGPYRGARSILRGDGGDPELFRRIRIHGNFTEVAPMTALALFAAESLGLGQGWLWAGVVSFFAGRVWHLTLYDSKWRGVPMSLSVGPGLLMSLWVLWILWA